MDKRGYKTQPVEEPPPNPIVGSVDTVPISNETPSAFLFDIIDIPDSEHGGVNSEIPIIIKELAEDSPTFNLMISDLEAMGIKLSIRLAKSKQDRKDLGTAEGKYYYDISGKSRILLSKAKKEFLVEEIVHAYQRYLRGHYTIQEREKLMKLIKASSTEEKREEYINQLRTISQRETVGEYYDATLEGDSFMEVEAKLISRIVRNEARENKYSRNKWNISEGAEGGPVIQLYMKIYHDGGKAPNLINDESSVENFYALQKNFQNYYIENAEEGRLESYKKGAQNKSPEVYNFIVSRIYKK